MSAAGGWYVTVAGAPPAGPYDNTSLLACVASGHVTTASVLWKEGRAGWEPLSSIPDLADVAAAAEAAAAKASSNPPAATAAAGTGPTQQWPNPTATTNGNKAAARAAAAAAANGTAAAPAGADDPMAEFQAEISAIEAATAMEEDQEGPSTPDELEFEDDDGTMYVWNAALRKYVPAGSDAAATAAGGGAPSGTAPTDYDLQAMTFVAEEEVLPTLAAAKAAVAAAAAAAAGEEELDEKAREKAERKRKVEAAMAEHKEKAAKRQAAEQQKQGWFDLKVNTSVYITGLPDDTTPAEVCAFFSKCGIVKLGDDGQPRIKLYKDKATGQLKGDGLVTYLKEPSVELACKILDGDSLRPGGPPLSVTVAKFEMKGGEYQAKAKAGKGKNSRKQQLEKLEKKLGWGGFDDKAPPEKVTVVMKHMFTPKQLQDTLTLGEELEKEITEECAKLGAVEKVRLYKAHPEGVVTVKFRTQDAAQQCLEVMDGRWFGGQRIVVALWDGLTNYADVKVQETEEEQAARLEAYARELEAAAQQQQQQGPPQPPAAAQVQ